MPSVNVNNATKKSYDPQKYLTTMASETAAQDMTTIKGKCDLCAKPDGYGGHNLQQCKKCGLLGKSENVKDNDFS